MICIVCMTLGRADLAVTIVQGNACCAKHINIVGLSRATSERINRFAKEEENS